MTFLYAKHLLPQYCPCIFVTLVNLPRLKLYIKTIMQNKAIVTSDHSVLEFGKVNMLLSLVNYFINLRKNKMADDTSVYEGDKKNKNANKKTKLGRIFVTFTVVLVSLCISVMAWDALDTSRSLHKTIELWEAEDPRTTTLGQVRQAVSGLWWFGPLKPDAAINPLQVCGVEGESSWWTVFWRLSETKERLSCLQEQRVLAHQDHEDFKTKVLLFSGLVLSVVCVMSCVFSAWWCKGTAKTKCVPLTTMELECVTRTLGEENRSDKYNDELFFTPTQGDEELLASNGQEPMHVTPPCTQENVIETSVEEGVLTTMDADEVLVNEEVREEDTLISSVKESSEINADEGKENIDKDNNKIETQTITPMNKGIQPVSTLKRSPMNLKETLQTPSNTVSEVMWTEVKNKKKQRKKMMIAKTEQTAIKQGKTTLKQDNGAPDKKKEKGTRHKGETDINMNKIGKENKPLQGQVCLKGTKDVGKGTQNPKSRVGRRDKLISSVKKSSEFNEKEGMESVDNDNQMETKTVTPMKANPPTDEVKGTQPVSTLKESTMYLNETVQTPSNMDSEVMWTEVKNKKKQRKKQMIAETEQTAIKQGKTIFKQDTGAADKKKEECSGRKGETSINVRKTGKENKGLRRQDRLKRAKDLGQGTQNPKSRVARRGPNTGTQGSVSKGSDSHTQTQLPGSLCRKGCKQGSVGRVKRPSNRCQGANTAARGTSRVMQKKASGNQVSTAILVPAPPQPLTKCWAQVVKEPKPELKIAANIASQKTDIKSRSTAKGRGSGPGRRGSTVTSQSSSRKVVAPSQAAIVSSEPKAKINSCCDVLKTDIKLCTSERESGTGCRGSTVTSQSSSGKVASPPQAAIVRSEPKAKVRSWADVLKTPKPDAAVSPASRKSDRGLRKEECASANHGSPSDRQQRGSANQRRGLSTRRRGYTIPGRGPSTPGRGSFIRGRGSSLQGSGYSLQGSGSSFHGSRSSIQESGSSLQGNGSSFQGSGSSIEGSGSSNQGSVSLQSAETASKTWAEEVDEAFPVPDECV